MQPDTSPIPHTLAQWFGLALATFIAAAGGWFARRKREPVELRKLEAETRQINVTTDVSLIQAATEALNKACRLQDERDHWERKAGRLEEQVDLLTIEVHAADMQMRKLSGYIKSKGLDASEIDKPE